MSNYIKNPDIMGIISGSSTAIASINRRPSHTLIFKVNGESVYYLRNKSVLLSPGTVLFVPENESYSFKKISDGESIYRLINFHAEIENPSPHLFKLPSPDSVESIFSQMERVLRFDNSDGGKYELLSLFYKLVSLLIRSEQTEYQTMEKKSRIDPAMDFLEAHLFDSELRTDSLHEFCGMSAPTFRRIFYSRFGTSPRKYINNQRLSQAKAILESGEYKNISEVAISVGYDDPLYFSRLFKEFYGSSPSKF